MSALLFLLVAEVIAIQIRYNTNIKGIKIGNSEVKIKMMADDTTLILQDLSSVELAIKDFNEFSKCSGLKLNLQKTEIIPIGSNIYKQMQKTVCEIKFKKGPFKTLGIWFSNNDIEMIDLNFNERIEKIKKMLDIWRSRNLSLRGKITILKSLVLPQILFLFNLIYVPKRVLDQIEELFFNFLWNGKPSKIKRNTIVGPISSGGLKMVDIYISHKVAKAMWIKRLTSIEQCHWKTLFLEMMQIEETLLNKKLDNAFLKRCVTPFHKQVLESWTEIYSSKPSNTREILNEYILYNKHIIIAKKTLSIDRFPNTFGNNVKIIDILDDNGDILKRSLLNERLSSNISQMTYNSLLSAIPKEWKRKLKEKSVNMTDKLTDSIKLKCNDVFISLDKITSKKMYNELIQRLVVPPIAIENWIDIYPFLEKHDWKYTFTLPSVVAKETYLQSFQYKIVTRILNCNYNLYKWGIKTSPACEYCCEVDTITHHLYECCEVETFWNQVQLWIYDKLEVMLHFTVCEILFGVIESDDLIRVINYIILYGKLYINKQRTYGKKLTLSEFISKLKDKIKIILSLDQINECKDIASPFFELLIQ